MPDDRPEHRRARRVLITDADAFLGPACVERFRRDGDDVVAITERLTSADQVRSIVADDGPFDVVVANLDVPITIAPIAEHGDDVVVDAFDRLVRPLYWLFAACLPPMVEAGRGAVVVAGSASALRGVPAPIAAYESTRATQAALVRSAAREVAASGVRVNAVAPNYVSNPSYYPPELADDERFQAALRRDVPAGRLGTPEEAAGTVAFLASDDAGFLVGAVLPLDGGWSIV